MKGDVMVKVPRVEASGRSLDHVEASQRLEGRNPRYRGCTREHFLFLCAPKEEER